MKSITESIIGRKNSYKGKDLKQLILSEIDMKDFPYIRETSKNYKNNLLDDKFLYALDNIQGCDNDFKIAAVYDMMGYIEAQYDINAGDDGVADQGAYNMIEMISDPNRNQNDFYAFIHTPSRGGNPSWSGLSQQYAEIAELFLDPDFELI
jgi:hypothetical protein